MFSANSHTAINSYRKVGLETGVIAASPHKLILMLYEGAIVAIALAQRHLRQKNIAARGQAISKAISIIDGGLKASLDLNIGGELARNLSELYDYMGRRLLYANLKNDRSALDEVAQLLEQLNEAWESIAAKPPAAIAPAATAAQPVSTAPASPSSQSRRVAAAYGSR